MKCGTIRLASFAPIFIELKIPGGVYVNFLRLQTPFIQEIQENYSFKMTFVSITNKICSQTQKNAKFWVWSVLISIMEKIFSKTCIFPLEFPGYWALERIVCHICPNHMRFRRVSLTAIYDLIRPLNLVRTSCNARDSNPTKFAIKQKKIR